MLLKNVVLSVNSSIATTAQNRVHLQVKFYAWRIYPTTWRHILSVFYGLACSSILVKVKFPHKSWQVWNYDRKCFIPCHLPSFITKLYTYTHPYLLAPHSPQLAGWYGSHFLNQESSKIPYTLCRTVLPSHSHKLWCLEFSKASACLWSGIEYRSTKVLERGWK